jgi:hypothetical protein
LTAFFKAGWAAVAEKLGLLFLLYACDEDWVGLLVDDRCKLSVINNAPNVSFLVVFLVGRDLEEMTGNGFGAKKKTNQNVRNKVTQDAQKTL